MVKENTINKWIVTGTNGAAIPFQSDSKITTPPEEFIKKLRAFSFANPDTGIMVLSGRTDDDLTEYYKKAFEPNEEGKIPKIVLASENGAFLRSSTDSDNLHKLTAPLSDELKKSIENLVEKAAGKCYCKEFPDLNDDEIKVRIEMKTFGLSIHYQVPIEKAEEAKVILEKIKKGFEDLVAKNPELHVDFNSENAFSLDLVSKGTTMEKLANHDPDLVAVFDKGGLSTSKPTYVAYSTGNRADWPALNAIDERIASGSLKGYTLRPNNYAPEASDSELRTRTPNSPKETGAGDSFYVLGSKEVSAQEQFLDKTANEHMSKIREELSNRGLLPSQSGDGQTPPIVLLTTGDILIQEPERYKPEILDKLEDWNLGKVILMANGLNSDSVRIKNLGLDNENLIAISPKGKVYSKGIFFDLERELAQAKFENRIFSSNPERSKEIELLRAAQEILSAKGLFKKNQLSQESTNTAALADERKPVAQKRSTASVQQEEKSISASPPKPDVTLLGQSPKDVASIHNLRLKRQSESKKRSGIETKKNKKQLGV